MCQARFRLDPRRLGDRGAKVTCSVCHHAFVVAAKEDISLDPFSTPVTLDSDDEKTEVSVMADDGAAAVDEGSESFTAERPVNQVHRQGLQKVELGAATFVGTIDPSLLRAARESADEQDLLETSGGLSADGTYTPPQEVTRLVNMGYSGLIGDQPQNDSGSVTQATEAAQTTEDEGYGDDKPHNDTASLATAEISSTTRFMRSAVTVAMVAGLTALGLFTLVRSGQLDVDVLKDPELIVHNSGVSGSLGIDGVRSMALRSLVYPTSRGGSVLVFTGEVQNLGHERVDNLDVVAELRDASGSLIVAAREPLGAVLTVAELAALSDQGSIDRAFAAKGASGTIGVGERIPYMVVIMPVPRQLRTGRHLVRLVQRPAETPRHADSD